MTTRLAYGHVLKADGTPRIGVAVSIQSAKELYLADGSVAPTPPLSVTTDENGRYETDLVVPGRYVVTIPGERFGVTVPAGSSDISLDGLRGSTGQPLTNPVQAAIDAALEALILGDLADVGAAAPDDGDVLTWDEPSATWVPAAPAGGAPTGGAGGVLSGQYPNPGFAVDMAEQSELDAHTSRSDNPHAVTAAQVGALTQAAADLRYVLASVFSESVDDRVASLLVSGSNITISYDDAAGTLTIAASGGGGGTTVTYGAWQDATLLNSWSQYNTVKPGYRLVSINGTPWYVELRGECFRSPAAATVMLTLATGYRPTWRQYVSIGTNTGAGVLLVGTSGDVEFQSGGAAPADLTSAKIYLI